MAAPRLLTQQDFTKSRYESLADQANDLASLIRRAEDIIGDKIGMTLVKSVYTETGFVKGSNLFLNVRPIVSVTSFGSRMFDRNAFVPLSNDTFTMNENLGILTLRSDVNIYGYQYQVTYEAGYTAVTLPEALREAILLQTALLLYQDFEIYGAGDSKEPGIRHFKDEINEYISPYIRSTLARA